MAKGKGRSLTTQTSNVPAEQAMQNKLRQAIFDGVKEQDVKDVVQGIVKRAKDGDQQAMKYFFEYILGGKSGPSKSVQNNFYMGDDDDQPDGESAMADASDRLEVMATRAARGKPVFGNGKS